MPSNNKKQWLSSSITVGRREWMLRLLHPSNVLIERIDRNKGELSYYLSFDEKSVDKDDAYRMIELCLLRLDEDSENDGIAIGVYSLTNKGLLSLATTAESGSDKVTLQNSRFLIHCRDCKRRLFVEGGFEKTKKCGPCATNKLESIYDIGLTW